MRLNPKRFKGDAETQDWLLPPSIGELLPEDHEARLIADIVDLLDLQELYANYSWEGGQSYHPKIMLRLLFYSYYVGQRGSRKIARSCREVISFMYLTNRQTPDFRTISDFRKNNLGILKSLFKQIVHLCYQLGMVTLEQISFDGSKITANASSRKHIVTKDKLEKQLAEVEEEIAKMFSEAETIDRREDELFGKDSKGDELPEHLKKAEARKGRIKELLAEMAAQETEKMSLTDKDSRFMKTTSGLKVGYNGHVATENQVILAAQLDNIEDDFEYGTPMIEEIEDLAVTLKGPKEYPLEDVKLLGDSGFNSNANLSQIKDRRIDGYIANPNAKRRAKEARGDLEPKPFSKDKFKYDAEQDCYICPAEQTLKPINKTKKKNKNDCYDRTVYRCDACPSCELQNECATGASGLRTINRYTPYDDLREQMDAKLNTDIGKAIYKQRAPDVEPVFGDIKTNIFRHSGFLLRGRIKVQGEFTLACICHDLKKLFNYLKSDENDKELGHVSPFTLQLA